MPSPARGRAEPKRTDWRTPDDLYAALNHEFRFDIDAAADAQNHLAPIWFGKGGLTEDAFTIRSVGRRSLFCNPPYTPTPGTDEPDLLQWVTLVSSWPLYGATVVLVVPCAPERAWYRLAYSTAWEERRTPFRVGFVDPETGLAAKQNVDATTIFVWRPFLRPYPQPASSYYDYRKCLTSTK